MTVSVSWRKSRDRKYFDASRSHAKGARNLNSLNAHMRRYLRNLVRRKIVREIDDFGIVWKGKGPHWMSRWTREQMDEAMRRGVPPGWEITTVSTTTHNFDGWLFLRSSDTEVAA